jgi:hypothetical protein
VFLKIRPTLKISTINPLDVNYAEGATAVFQEGARLFRKLE